MGCTSCGNTVYSASGACSSCGGDCGTPKVVVTNTVSGTPGTPGRGYDAISATSTDLLDTGALGISGAVITIEKAYTPGARVRFSDTASPSVNYFEGIVAAYDPLTGIMDVGSIDLKKGTGTISSWDVNLAGELGEGSDYYFEISQSIDFLDSYVIPELNAVTSTSLGDLIINASNLGKSKSYHPGTPVKITPTAQVNDAGSRAVPVPKIEGFVNSYTTQTGDMTIRITGIQGVGTFTEWSVDLNYDRPTVDYVQGILLPPSGAGSQHGSILIPGNTIFKPNQTIKANFNGEAIGNAFPFVVTFDGVTLFSKVLTSAEIFDFEITINVGSYVTLSAQYTTASGTDDDIQYLGGGNAAYNLTTYKGNFKTDLLIDFQLYSTNPVKFYSGVAYRL
jgi:hypothetical protein